VIGVIANPAEDAVVREFFELFKTAWEWWQCGREYDVVLCVGGSACPQAKAKLILVYDTDRRSQPKNEKQPKHDRVLAYRGARIPIYGASVTFPEGDRDILVDEGSGEPAVRREGSEESTVIRIGYDLFHEVRWLLTNGQPIQNASCPTLELHIALLRDLIFASGAALIEIPPVPGGYQFIACLTHDVDHPFIRKHKLDHTTLGFLYRAVAGSLIDTIRGRRSLAELFRNWAAALKLPLVHAGLAEDFWARFDRYPKLEGGARSSFFVIPFEATPGLKNAHSAPRHRAAHYGVADLIEHIKTLTAEGCEIGLHGIDAWQDISKGRAELNEVRKVTGTGEIGVRMHWLYFDQHSPEKIEQAGADYDSTVGYNETVGYRAGTSQAYQPLGTTRLIELPLHVMDTALFYPTHLHLSSEEAQKTVSAIVDNAVRFGGVVTVNWHDRSIAPERLWGDFYVNLVSELKEKGAWFATAAEAVRWFRKRRAMVLDRQIESSRLPAATASVAEDGPALHFRVHAGADSRPSDRSAQLVRKR
jgi:hypothetical protein